MTFHNITSLTSSHEYQFRVIAENFYGKSEPCEPTAVIKTDESDAIKKKRAQEGKSIIVICCWVVDILQTLLCLCKNFLPIMSVCKSV